MRPVLSAPIQGQVETIQIETIGIKRYYSLETLGDRIRQIRHSLGLTQVEFAHKLGYEKNTVVSYWESNTTQPDLNTLLAICDLGNVTERFILRGSD